MLIRCGSKPSDADCMAGGSKMLTPEDLRNLLEYNPETGLLRWRVRPASLFSSQRSCSTWNARYAGQPAMTAKNAHGYAGGPILGKTYLAHRVIWAIAKGFWPEGEIDHVNGDRTDNRLSNLREVDHRENSMNASKSHNNSSGETGVYWRSDNRKWAAKIGIEGKLVHLGCFDTFDEAVAARKLAANAQGFSDRHGNAIGKRLYGRRR